MYKYYNWFLVFMVLAMFGSMFWFMAYLGNAVREGVDGFIPNKSLTCDQPKCPINFKEK